MKKLKWALALSLLLAFGLTACGPGAPDPAPPPEQSTGESSARSEPEPGTAEPAQEPEPLTWGGDGSVEGFRSWAGETWPRALAGVARVGVLQDYTGGDPFWESLDTGGFPPFLVDYGDTGPIWADICEDDPSGQGKLWCIFPMSEDTVVSFTRSDWNGESLEPVEQSETPTRGRPLLFYWNTTCYPAPTLHITVRSGEREAGFDLATNSRIPPQPQVPPEGLLLPGDGQIFDFTTYPGLTPVTPWLLSGRWSSWDGEKDHELWFHPDGRLTLWQRGQEEPEALWQTGSWAMEENGQITLSYAPLGASGVSGTALSLTPELLPEGELLLHSREGRQDFCTPEGEPMCYREHAHFPAVRQESEDSVRAVELAKDCYEQQIGPRPAHGRVLFYTQTGPLVELWDDGPAGPLIRGYRVAFTYRWEVMEYRAAEQTRSEDDG